MFSIKHATLLLSASAMLTMGAQAADLPSRKAAPVEYVRVCNTYGAGYYWIPGTDTCLKLGGRVRVDAWYTPAKNAVVHRSTAAGGIAAGTFVSANAVDQNGWYARGLVMMDARTESAWGTVQTAMTLRLSSSSGLAIAPPGYPNSVFASGNSSSATIEAAYIRFAGFTIGQAANNFTFLPGLWLAQIYGGFPNGIRQLAYTATFGQGFSATVALENRGDQISSYLANSLGSNPFTATAATLGPIALRLPAFVANVRVDQSWGSAMLSGLVLENTATFGNANLAVVGGAGPQVRRTGWALLGGLRINLPMLAAGDFIAVSAAYGVGALDYIVTPGANGNYLSTANFLGGFLRTDRNLTLFCTNAACTAGGSEQTKAFNVAGYLTHYWTPSLRSVFSASYARLTPGTTTRATTWAQGGLSQADLWQVVGQLVWSPVRNFDIGVEMTYQRLKQTLPLTPVVAVPASVNPSNWTMRVRAERTF